MDVNPQTSKEMVPLSFVSVNLTKAMTSHAVTDVRMSHPGNETESTGYVIIGAERQRIIVIAVIMAFTLIGNITLILVLQCNRSRRIKRVNILLMNLAFGDLTVALFVNSTEILFLAFGDWALGEAVCKLIVYVQMICLSSATNLLTAMSIDRYQVIVKPMQSLARRPRIWLKIAVAWALSLLFPIPQLFIFIESNDGLKYDGSLRRVCASHGYTASWQRKVYISYTTTYILLVPVAIMLYCYAKIIRVVWIRANSETRRRPICLTAQSSVSTASCVVPHPLPEPHPDTCPGHADLQSEHSDSGCGCEGKVMLKIGSKSPRTVRWGKEQNRLPKVDVNVSHKLKVPDPAEDDMAAGSPRMSIRRSLVTASKRRALVMTLTVIIGFLLCHTPYFLTSVVRIFSNYQLKLEKARVVSEFLVMVHSTMNPLLYGLFTLRQYHLKYALSLLTCSFYPLPRSSKSTHRLHQYSQDRRKIISHVRTKLGSISSCGTSTANSAAMSSDSGHSSHTDPLLGRKRNKTEAARPASTTPAPVSLLAKLQQKTKQFRDRRRQNHAHPLDQMLFANTEAIRLTYQRPVKLVESVHSELDSLATQSADGLPQCTLITNSHAAKVNGNITPPCVRGSQEVGLLS